MKQFVAFLTAILLFSYVSGKPISMSLQDLVDASDSICEIKVEQSRGRKIKVTKIFCVKGDLLFNKIVTDGSSEAPILVKKKTYLLFLDDCVSYSVPINGFVGAIILDAENNLYAGYISDEPFKSNKWAFYDKIRKSISNGSSLSDRVDYCKYISP